MRLPDDINKYSHKWKWIEIGKYDAVKDRVFRITAGPQGKKRPVTILVDKAEEFADKNNRFGIYTSVFHYNDPDYEKATRLGSLYFDLDSKDPKLALKDAIILVQHLLEHVDENHIRIYFTGMKGFHIELEALAIGISPGNELPSIFRLIANDLKDRLELTTLDFAVYDLRRMWRLPNTKHQKTGLYKIPLSVEDIDKGLDHILKLAENPIPFEVPEQEFSYGGNRWYKEYEYKHEASKLEHPSLDDIISMFAKKGTSGVRHVPGERVFNPVNLFDNCKSIMRLWNKSEETGHLEHEERLFLCSILTYTEEATEYLHMMLANCHDYNYEKSKSHIDDWLARRKMGIGGRPYTCRRANEAGVGCMDCDLSPKKKYYKINGVLVESDEEADPSPIRFAYTYVNVNDRKGSYGLR